MLNCHISEMRPGPQKRHYAIKYTVLTLQSHLKKSIWVSMFIMDCLFNYNLFHDAANSSDYLSMALQPFVGPWPLFQLLGLLQSRQDSSDGSYPFARPQSAHMTAQTQIKRTQTSIPRVGFEPTTTVSEMAKAVHTLDRAATVIDSSD
jgi:hypothetical protein